MKIYQVDAFTQEQFKGNPACVCVLPANFEADEAWMQNVASEMNLSETAFVQAQAEGTFSLRWFTPTTEVDLCGHATLATSHILWQEGFLDKKLPALFDTRSGRLEVTLLDSWIRMNFPVDKLKACREPVGLEMALGCSIIATYDAGQDLLIEVVDEKTVAELVPSLQQLSLLAVRCCVVTSQGSSEKIDFVSRVFGPQVGIDEDPVTGSTHCSLTPFWAERLSKSRMTARQLSQRGGTLEVELLDDRVAISGQAVTVFKAELNV